MSAVAQLQAAKQAPFFFKPKLRYEDYPTVRLVHSVTQNLIMRKERTFHADNVVNWSNTEHNSLFDLLQKQSHHDHHHAARAAVLSSSCMHQVRNIKHFEE
eukprot:jgi/Psemu1/16224/gm1.16224_g